MKFPSVRLLAQDALNVLKRFPLEVAFALMGTVAETINIKRSHHNYEFDSSFYIRLVMSANLGLLLNLSVTLFCESKLITGIIKWLYHLFACTVILGLFFILNPFDNGSADFIRFFLISLALHLLVSFAAFTGNTGVNGFWQFNKALFLRFLSSVLYGVVLFLGLAAALGAMNFLFNTKFEGDTFFTLWAWITGMFVTVFFLAGVPADWAALHEDSAYPKALKIFTQYVLIPLATVYLVILLAYEGKILLEWRLPKGMVSDMVLGYAVFGILSLLLLYPIRNLEENRWLKTYARSFYFLMIPLIVLLFVATGARIFKYGITEYRYFLIMLSCWLFIVTAYFLVSKKQNIKLIPVSLCVLALLSVYGPQSAFSVAMYSQRRILVNIFKKYNAFDKGMLQSLKDKKVTKKDGRHAVATLDYLIHEHDLTSLQPYFIRDLRLLDDSLKKDKDDSGKVITVRRYALRDRKLEWAKNNLGLTKFNWSRYAWEDSDTTEDLTKNFYLNAKDVAITDVKGYDYTVDLQRYKQLGGDSVMTYKELKNVQQYSDERKGIYALTINGLKHAFILTPLIQRLTVDKNFPLYKTGNNDYSETYDLPQEMLVLSDTTKNYVVTLRLSHLQIIKTLKTNAIQPNEVTGVYFVKVRR